MPVTADARHAAARRARVGLPERRGRGGLAAGARARCPTAGRPPARCRRAPSTPATRRPGSFALTVGRPHGGAAAGVRLGGAVRGRRQGPGHALALAVPLRPARRSCSSWPPGCCWRSRSSAAAGRAPAVGAVPGRRAARSRDGDAVTPAHHSRERRWRVLALVVLVVAGVGVAVGVPGHAGARRRRAGARARWSARPTRSRPPGTAPGSPPRRACRRASSSSPTRRRDPSPPTITAVTDAGAAGAHRRRRPGPRRGGPGHPRAVVGFVGVRDRDRSSGGGVAVTQAVHGSSGWSQAPCQSTTSAQWYFAGGSTAAANALYVSLLNPDVDAGRGRSQLRDAGRRGPPDQLPGDRAAGRARWRWRTWRPRCRTISTVSTVVSTRTGPRRRVGGAGARRAGRDLRRPVARAGRRRRPRRTGRSPRRRRCRVAPPRSTSSTRARPPRR